MENLGSLAILLAFCLGVYAIIGSVAGRLKRNPFLILSAERAVYSVWFLVTVASGILVYALMTGDFRYSYVAQYSNRAMPLAYKFSAWWGGQEGSLLLWSWLLASYSCVAVFTNRRKLRDVMPEGVDPQRRDGIEVATAVDVDQLASFGPFDDDRRVVGEARHLREPVPQHGGIALAHDARRLTDAIREADVLTKCDLARALHRRAIGERIAEWHAKLEHVRPSVECGTQQPGRGGPVRIADGQVHDDREAFLLARSRERSRDPRGPC